MNLFYPFLVLLIFALPAQAQTPSFQSPVDCTLGQDCWIANYVDTDPADPARDFTCGPRSYNEHHGTDFAIADQVSVERGVDVIAAADGTVLRVRDGIDDIIVSKEARLKMLAENKGCGNGVFIDHGAGWQTIYCHMKKGSLVVKPDTPIKAGDKIGEIGYSGIAEFPHLHFGVFFEGNTVDPFTGAGETEGCAQMKKPLWASSFAPAYEPVSIYAAGFKAGIPDFEAVKIDAVGAGSVSSASDALTFWVLMFGVAANDVIKIEIQDPLGRVFAERTINQEETRARQFYFVGRKTHEKGLETGQYTGHVKLERAGENGETIIKETSRTLTVK